GPAWASTVFSFHTSRLSLRPLDEFLFRNYHTAPHTQRGEAGVIEQLVGGGDGHAQYLRHHLGVEEQRQVVVGFVDRQFQCLVPPVFQIQRKNSCVSEVSLLNWDTDQAVFSETRQAAELLQQFSGFFTGSVFFFSGFGHAPYPFLPCGLV